MRYLTERDAPGQFYWEDPSDVDNVFIAFKNEAGGLTVAVSDEKAIDSDNETFECAAALNEADAVRLRDYLIRAFPAPLSS